MMFDYPTMQVCRGKRTERFYESLKTRPSGMQVKKPFLGMYEAVIKRHSHVANLVWKLALQTTCQQTV